MKRRTFLATIVAAPALLAATRAGLAQTPAATPGDAFTPINELPGIEAVISRVYGPDIQSMLEATPGLRPEDFSQDLASASVMVYQFDSPENAAAAFDLFREDIGGQLLGLSQAGTPTVSAEDLAELGDGAAEATLSTDTEGYVTWYRFVLVHEAEYFFVISALAEVPENVEIANDIATWVIDEGEPQGDQAIFVADGGSSGGLWGFLPTAGEPVLQDLIPVTDETLYPAPQD
jgi:hypothetical protein